MIPNGQLKVGDKVIITRAATAQEREVGRWRNVWVPSMNSYIGKTVIICRFVENGTECHIKDLDNSYIPWGWPTFVMKKVKKVSSQLVFNFMK